MRFFPWISREDEHIRDECVDAINWMIDLCADIEPDIWDCMQTMRELVVAKVVYEIEYGKTEEDLDFVPQDVREKSWGTCQRGCRLSPC